MTDTTGKRFTAVTPRNTRSRQSASMKTAQHVLLIWLDENIDRKNEADYRNTITQLRRVVNNVNTFTDSDQCIKFIKTIDSNEHKVCLITSGSLGRRIVPYVHGMSQVDSIFIFCNNKIYHKQWTEGLQKIKGIFTEIKSICEALNQAVRECERNAIPISFLATDSDNTNQNISNQLDCSFMYTQIFKDIALTINFGSKDIEEFIEYCRQQFAGNKSELVTVDQLENGYNKNKAIWWYTYESFLYKMLNNSLRLMNVSVMIMMGFFITDLHQQIKKLHTEQFGNSSRNSILTLYRGQGMSNEHFQQMSKTKGGLISFNNFLSTSKSRSVSLNFACNARSNPDLIGILFVISIDPAQSTIPFASVNKMSAFGDTEEEVLFSMHSIFRIRDIKSLSRSNNLYQVDLILTNDNDNDLRAVSERIRNALGRSTGWDRLGRLLLEMRESEQTEKIYNNLIKQTTDPIEKAAYYEQLGWAKHYQAKYNETLEHHAKSLAIRKQYLAQNDIHIVYSYKNIAFVYYEIGKYEEALSYYKKALEILQQSFHANDPALISIYNDIGYMYYNMRQYSNALSYYKKALAIQERSVSANEFGLAHSYNNIGLVYHSMGEYSNALSYYKRTLDIKQKLLSSNDPDLAYCYHNIGSTYDSMGNYEKALWAHEKTLQIRKRSLTPNHPYIASSYNNIGMAYKNMGDYQRAHVFLERAVEIAKISMPNHRDFKIYVQNLNSVRNFK